MPKTVDIVIPVYRGEPETRACIESVLAARLETPHEVVVIDDSSPEPALSAWLRTLAEAGRITLRSHAQNRGFVATANEGMALHPDRDVVLLNSDTQVAPGWLDRLSAHIRRDERIGTATPFSNNATICSYPRTLVANAMPAGEGTADLDAAFAAANAGRNVDVPTAVGFCMYISRPCMERVGLFDEARYGAGYGEEVDFCMRASRAGFRHVLAADVFVRHVGEVSFGDSGLDRRAHAQRVVDELYPEFQERLRVYIPADPARALRRRADLERLRRKPREAIVQERHGKHFVRLRWDRPGEEFELWLHETRDAAALERIASLVRGEAAGLPELRDEWLRAPEIVPEPAPEPAPAQAPSAWWRRMLQRLR